MDVNESRSHPWVGVVLLVGLAYFLVGWSFTWPTTHVQGWRLGAWAFSAVAYGLHIGYEHFRRVSPPLSTALHAAVAVAIGAFLLAVAGALHALVTAGAIGPLWLLAFVAWPAITAVPAFLVALVGTSVLTAFRRNGTAAR